MRTATSRNRAADEQEIIGAIPRRLRGTVQYTGPTFLQLIRRRQAHFGDSFEDALRVVRKSHPALYQREIQAGRI